MNDDRQSVVHLGRRDLLKAIGAGAVATTVMFGDAAFHSSTAQMDVPSRQSVHMLAGVAKELGAVIRVIHAAGVSPTRASPATILKVELHGTALFLEESGDIMEFGG